MGQFMRLTWRTNDFINCWNKIKHIVRRMIYYFRLLSVSKTSLSLAPTMPEELLSLSRVRSQRRRFQGNLWISETHSVTLSSDCISREQRIINLVGLCSLQHVVSYCWLPCCCFVKSHTNNRHKRKRKKNKNYGKEKIKTPELNAKYNRLWKPSKWHFVCVCARDVCSSVCAECALLKRVQCDEGNINIYGRREMECVCVWCADWICVSGVRIARRYTRPIFRSFLVFRSVAISRGINYLRSIEKNINKWTKKVDLVFFRLFVAPSTPERR